MPEEGRSNRWGNSQAPDRDCEFAYIAWMHGGNQASQVYEQIALEYARHAESAPFNALYERPAMLALIGDVAHLSILEVGCGPGYYLQCFVEGGASRVVGVDSSPTMVEVATERVGGRAETLLASAEEVEAYFESGSFDRIVCPLVLHYIKDWKPLFASFRRLLRTSGSLVFSVGHPMADFEASVTRDYYEVELLEEEWSSFGVRMPTYRRSLAAVFESLDSADFVLEKLVEPRPAEAMSKLHPGLYDRLSHKPHFLCIRACRSPR